MISYIKGILTEVFEDTIVVEAGSIGYNIHVPLSLLERIPRIGSEVKIFTYFQVREDAMSLYGFLSRQDLDMFKQLIGVNGIGPKGALGVLSTLTPENLRMAVLSGDAKAIAKAPGIGIKTAQRVILDLKDRIHMEDLLPQEEVMDQPGAAMVSRTGREAMEALTALGYSGSEAAKAVKQVEITDSMTVEDVLKASLKHLSFL